MVHSNAFQLSQCLVFSGNKLDIARNAALVAILKVRTKLLYHFVKNI